MLVSPLGSTIFEKPVHRRLFYFPQPPNLRLLPPGSDCLIPGMPQLPEE
jgi:hypothetical protein